MLQIETSLCQVLGDVGLLLRPGLWPVLAGVKVVPARARSAGPGGAPPGLRLRSGWIGAYQEQAGMRATVDRWWF